MVTCAALGGWIPTVTINNATASVLRESVTETRTHMEKKFKK
jgi:hypothetical protein